MGGSSSLRRLGHAEGAPLGGGVRRPSSPGSAAVPCAGQVGQGIGFRVHQVPRFKDASAVSDQASCGIIHPLAVAQVTSTSSRAGRSLNRFRSLQFPSPAACVWGNRWQRWPRLCPLR
ncbi:uncharacterized protein VSU04_010406 isoform 1-T2 [Chlamydotis macqueenii]